MRAVRWQKEGPLSPTRPDPASTDQVWTLAQLATEFSARLEREWPALWVRGEISGYSHHAASGHRYFTLKDSKAQFPAVFWRSRAEQSVVQPANGLQVEAQVRLVFYGPGGKLQLEVQRLRAVGRGDLMQALLDLKQRLAQEGLFDAGRKRPLPAYPRHLGLLTALGGAALQDMLKILGRRWPLATCHLLPVPVQGPGAGPALADGLRRLAQWPGLELDLIILGRGGGSFEDLHGFNDEGLVRAIAWCPIPVISAVGHEIDTTLSDLAADLRAPTPSAAAELAVPELEQVLDQVQRLGRGLHAAMLAKVQGHLRQLRALGTHRALARPEQRFRQAAQRVDELELRLRGQVVRPLAQRRDGLDLLRRRLQVALQRVQGEASQRSLDWPRRLELPVRRHLREGDLAATTRLGELTRAMRRVLDRGQERLHLLEARLEKLESGRLRQRMLRMGFLLARDEAGVPLSTLSALAPGARIQLEFHGGEAEAELLRIKEHAS